MSSKRIFGMVLLIGLFLSCKKSDSVFGPGLDNALIGTWQRAESIPSGRSAADFRYFVMESTFRFGKDATYSYTLDFYGFEDENPNEIIGSSERIGTFEVKGDRIFFRDIETTSWENGFNPTPQTKALNGQVYENRFEIAENVLTLHYISYPADAPVQTQMSYKRVE
ncbi:hypothetical protein [Spongiimicrobium sp. 2-473A-2-J]|uniref:hypothetical protein n=1 Tax=Eudoraea algarum TaxID=3417568 RepID=UPI003D36C5C6